MGFRYSLTSLLGLTTFCGVAVASLMPAWRGWAPAVVFSGAVFTLLLSTPLAFVRQTGQRYWLGFAAVGWGYMFLAFSPWFEANVGRQLLAYPIAESVCWATTDSLGDAPHFLRVAHALSLCLAAHAGGCLTHRAAGQSAVAETCDQATINHEG